MTISSCIGLILAMFVLAVTPGPGVFATVARAMASGFRSTIPLICGIILGDLTFLLLAVCGMSMLAQAFGQFFFLVKIIGGLYLIFLGVRIWRSAPQVSAAETGNLDQGSGLKNFSSGLAITLSNPKVILFYCGFLPTFIDLTALNHGDLLAVTAIVAMVIGLVLSCYAYLASRARLLFTSRRSMQIFNRAAGGVMVATGVTIATR